MTWIQEHIETILATLFGGGGFFGWVYERNKRRSNALVAMQKLYDEFVKDASEKYAIMHAEIDTLKKEIKEINSQWLTKYNALLNNYNKLKSEFEKYKKSHP